MTGKEIKQKAEASGVRLWQIAKEYGVADTTFSRYLRGEFSETETEKIISIIEKLAK